MEETSASGAINSSGHRLIGLQALRGLAACAVMLYHAAHYSVLRGAPPWLESAFSPKLAYYGVLVFFVLSGFLMEGAVRRYDARTFILHRFARLYPTFWIVCLAFFLIQSARAGAWEQVHWKALTLLPVGETLRPLAVEWTLVFEVFFYAICALLCLRPRAHLPVHLIWLVMIVVLALRGVRFDTGQPTLAQMPIDTWNLGFVCGGLAGHANRWLVKADAANLWLVGIAMLLLGPLTSSIAGLLLADSGIACIVIAATRTVPAGRGGPGIGMRALFLLGEYSYGLYLAHCVAIQIALQYVEPSRLAEPLAVFAGMVGVGLGAGLLAGSIDIRLYRALKAFIDHRFRKRAPAGDAVAR